jgi:tetratricopeptide (TPR) repeat protein
MGRHPETDVAPVEQAREARALEDLGAYSRAADLLRQLRGRVAPDVDLEIALALDEARTGRLDSAWVRLHGPLLSTALADSMPVTRRTEYTWRREDGWINARFDGWYWYIARARVEVAVALGRWSEARNAARLCVAARPLAGKEWLILAVCAGRAGDLALAAAGAEQAAFLDRSLPESQYLHGLHQWKAGRRASAEASFRAALALDSTYREPALALARMRLPSTPPPSLPLRLLTGVREIGLLASPARPKIEEFVQIDAAAAVTQLINPIFPYSLQGKFPGGQMSLSILIDESGRIVLHELPWYEPPNFPASMVSLLTASLPHWRFEPARRLGAPHRVWTVVQLNFKS